MDWTKYPLEKLFSFVAAVIPGSVLLLIFGQLHWFFALGFLGYRTKLSLAILAAFVFGFTATTFLSAILGAIGGAIGAASYKPPHSYDTAPWRDPEWRQLVKQRLGPRCPNDSRPMSSLTVDLRTKLAAHLPQDQQADALIALHGERLAAESDDLSWSMLYGDYHNIVLEPTKDVVWHVHTGLTFNLETAALIVLLSAAAVPVVRHWWCILPSCIWVLLLVVETTVTMKKALDKWSTLSDQIKYLSTDANSREIRAPT
jgi:hypothetical protein